MMEPLESDEEAPRRRLTRVVVNWVVLPTIAASLVIALGVHLGARNPDAWYSVAVRFITGLF